MDGEAASLPPEKYLVPRHSILDARRGLPRPPFFWTLDQVAAMLGLSLAQLSTGYLWRVGRDTGRYDTTYLRAVNVNPAVSPGEWRVADGEFVRWLHVMDLWIYDPSAQLADIKPSSGTGESTRSRAKRIRLPKEPAHAPHPNDEQPDPALLDL